MFYRKNSFPRDILYYRVHQNSDKNHRFYDEDLLLKNLRHD
jgi:hypothetical protein